MKDYLKPVLITSIIAFLVLIVVVTTPTFSPKYLSESASASIPSVAPVTVIIPEKSPEERFQYAVKVVLKHEGGLSNNKADPGGITKYGLSLRFLKNENIDDDGDGDVDLDDVIHLDLSDADEIYAKFWWQKYNYNEINDLKLATKIFDSSVNMGASQCHKLLKRAINRMVTIGVPENGVLDTHTIALINKMNAEHLLENLRLEERDFYLELVERHPPLKVFEKGWLNRAKS